MVVGARGSPLHRGPAGNADLRAADRSPPPSVPAPETELGPDVKKKKKSIKLPMTGDVNLLFFFFK